MVKIDENQEAIALICMAIDNDNKAQTSQNQAGIEYCGVEPPSDLELHIPRWHWTFGSCSGTQLDCQDLEKIFAQTNHDFVSFDECLSSFIVHNFPEEAPHYGDFIYVYFS